VLPLLKSLVHLVAAQMLAAAAGKVNDLARGSVQDKAGAGGENEDDLVKTFDALVVFINSGDLPAYRNLQVLKELMGVLPAAVKNFLGAIRRWAPRGGEDPVDVIQSVEVLAGAFDLRGEGWVDACCQLVLVLEPEGRHRDTILKLLSQLPLGADRPPRAEINCALRAVQELTAAAVPLTINMTVLKMLGTETR
jgi:hypothetical protein